MPWEEHSGLFCSTHLSLHFFVRKRSDVNGGHADRRRLEELPKQGVLASIVRILANIGLDPAPLGLSPSSVSTRNPFKTNL